MAAISGFGNDELRRLQAQQAQLTGNTQSTQQAAALNEESSIIPAGADTDADITLAEDDFAQAAAALQGTGATSAASATGSTSGTERVATTEEGQKILDEIEELEKEKEENLKKMDKLEAHIEDLTEKAEANIMKAAAAQEEAVKEHEDEASAVVDEQLKAYVAANKEGGEGMTREDLQSNIQGALAHIPEVANAVSALVEANDQINEIDSCLGELNSLITDTQSIEAEIEGKEAQFEATEEAAQAASVPSSGCCDPIGFQTTDESGNTVQYDFIKDDGSFDSTSDFLGSDNQWAEMQALDTDGDQVVTASELSAGNIKAVKTNADGSQEIVDLADEFGDDFSIDLASYKQGGSHSAIDTTKDSDGDGIADQELLGTFNVNANGQSIQGYNTLDDVDFLSENYGVSSATAAEGTETTDSFESEYSEDLQPHVDFFNTYSQKVQELKEALMQGWDNLDISEDTMKDYNETSISEANQKAANFFKSLELSEEEGENETSITDEVELGNESDVTSDAELEKELDKDLEFFAA